ncbi:MAG: hypothetical protein ACTHJW_28200 [Streptosporangiaceae bacterium]
MIASDIASSKSGTGRTEAEQGRPEADPDSPEPDWSASDPGLEARPAVYRQLWGPPGRRQAPRQALGQPYVWDGGRFDVDRYQFPADDEYDEPEPSAVGRPRPARQRETDPLTGPAPMTERAIIGDFLRELAAWCQIGACIARYTDAGALGEVDIRARAVAIGWCLDLFGRLICPSCQQRDPVWSARPLVVREPAGDMLPASTEMQIGRHRRMRWPTPDVL